MTKRLIILTGAVFILGFAFWSFSHRKSTASEPSPQKDARQAASSVTKPPAQTVAPDSEETELSSEEKIEKVLQKYIVPITFYGKVIDEKGNPVTGAKATFSASDLSETGNTRYEVTSENDGRFSLEGVKGGGILIHVEKEGYYAPIGGQYFYYSHGTKHIPDPNDPVVFYLHKKGEAAELVKVDKTVRIPKDGTPVEISLLTGKAAPAGQGHIKVECWTMDQNKNEVGRYDWRCRITVPNGGLIEPTQEFDFEAPADGYRSFDEINMPATTFAEDSVKRWSSSQTRKYFFQLGDGNYARMEFEMLAGGREQLCWIKSYLNPDKSRNLEYDKSKEIRVVEKKK